MEDPVNKNTGHVKYVCYVKANSIPKDFDNWIATNPREQKMTTNVANKIIESLENNSCFHELNRGILLSDESVTYDTKEGIVSVTLASSSRYKLYSIGIKLASYHKPVRPLKSATSNLFIGNTSSLYISK